MRAESGLCLERGSSHFYLPAFFRKHAMGSEGHPVASSALWLRPHSTPGQRHDLGGPGVSRTGAAHPKWQCRFHSHSLLSLKGILLAPQKSKGLLSKSCSCISSCARSWVASICRPVQMQRPGTSHHPQPAGAQGALGPYQHPEDNPGAKTAGSARGPVERTPAGMGAAGQVGVAPLHTLRGSGHSHDHPWRHWEGGRHEDKHCK